MRIFFANGSSKLITVNSDMTASQLCTIVADKLHLESEAAQHLEVIEAKKNERTPCQLSLY